MVTLDTNVAVYGLSAEDKRIRAREVLQKADFVSVQVLNEYARTAQRKLRREWPAIERDLTLLRTMVPAIRPIDGDANRDAVRIAQRYKLGFYDALMLSVALAGGALTIYSEDMQNDLLIDGTLRIVDPFR